MTSRSPLLGPVCTFCRANGQDEASPELQGVILKAGHVDGRAVQVFVCAACTRDMVGRWTRISVGRAKAAAKESLLASVSPDAEDSE